MTELSTTGVRAAAHRLRTLADEAQAQLVPAVDGLALPPTAFGALIEVYRWYERAVAAVDSAGRDAATALADAGDELAGFVDRHTAADEDAAAQARRDQP
jgi:hypothetical protein